MALPDPALLGAFQGVMSTSPVGNGGHHFSAKAAGLWCLMAHQQAPRLEVANKKSGALSELH